MSKIKTTERLFPIKDHQFHQEGLEAAARTVRGNDFLVQGEDAIAIAWHSTACAYLAFGVHHDLDGPGAEEIEHGRVTGVRAIKDHLRLAYDDNGFPFMMHEFK